MNILKVNCRMNTFTKPNNELQFVKVNSNKVINEMH